MFLGWMAMAMVVLLLMGVVGERLFGRKMGFWHLERRGFRAGSWERRTCRVLERRACIRGTSIR